MTTSDFRRSQNRLLLLAFLLAVVSVLLFASAARGEGVHHPDCVTTYRDLPHDQDTPVAGQVWLKAGPAHYSLGYQPAGYDVPATYAGKDTSHYDVCTTTDTSTTEPPETTSTTEPSSSTTEPPSTSSSTAAPTTSSSTTEPPSTSTTSSTTTTPSTSAPSSTTSTIALPTTPPTAVSTTPTSTAVDQPPVPCSTLDHYVDPATGTCVPRPICELHPTLEPYCMSTTAPWTDDFVTQPSLGNTLPATGLSRRGFNQATTLAAALLAAGLFLIALTARRRRA